MKNDNCDCCHCKENNAKKASRYKKAVEILSAHKNYEYNYASLLKSEAIFLLEVLLEAAK